MNKIDLLPYLEYDKELAVKYILQIHPDIPVFEISAKTGDGLDLWIDWLKGQIRKKLG